jgi:ribosomal protein L7/L12
VSIITIVLIALFVAAVVLCFLLRFRERARVAPELVALFRTAGASEHVAGYLARGQRRKARQAYQTEHSVSLHETKDAIAQLRLTAAAPATMRAAGIPAPVVAQLERGAIIAAIKTYRTEKQVSLREAKATVDQLLDL